MIIVIYIYWKAQKCDTNVAAYCGLIAHVMDLIIADMCSLYQAFEDFIKRD